MKIEAASFSHVKVLVAIHTRCFEDAWSTQAMVEVLSSPGAFACIALAENPAASPAGFSLARVIREEAEVLTLCVLPEHRRQRTAIALLEETMRRARQLGAQRIFLEVAENNDPARALYEGRGFAAVGRRPDYYRLPNAVPVAALTLRRDLSSPK